MLTAMATRNIRLRVGLDRHRIAIAWALGLVIYPAIGPFVFYQAALNKWTIESIYSYVFDVFSIITGLLFAFYSILVSSDNDFMKYVRETNKAPFKQFRKEMRISIAIGAALTLGSIIYLVIQPKPIELWSLESLLVAIWFATVCAGFTAFYRVATAFILIADNPPSRPTLG